MILRRAIQSILGINLIAVYSSSYVYGFQSNSLKVADNLCQVYSTEKAIENKFYSGELNTREGITNLENILKAIDQPFGEDCFPLFHTFSDGLFTREMHAPAGHLMIGKIHTTDHLVHLLKGSLLVADEFGTKRLDAPVTFSSKSGVKRVGYTFEDTVWMDIYKTDKTTVKDAMNELYCNTYEEYENMNYTIDIKEAL